MTVGFVSEIALLKNVPDSCLEMLEENSRTLEVVAGRVFFSAGQPAEAVFLLERGSVRIFRIFGARKITIAMLQPPALFGEIGCFGQGTHHCSAESVQDSQVRWISRNSIQALLECAPNLAHGVIDLIGERFEQFLAKLETHALKGTLPRLATLLREKLQEDMVRGLTHKDLADELGVHRESVTAALGELRRAGIITTERKTIRVLHLARLERASRE